MNDEIKRDILKVNVEQIEILDKLLKAEAGGDDPSINKKQKRFLIKQIRKTKQIPEEWWYELMEAIGCYAKDLTDTEQEIIIPIYDAIVIKLERNPPKKESEE